jgi:hypothetical protein
VLFFAGVTSCCTAFESGVEVAAQEVSNKSGIAERMFVT